MVSTAFKSWIENSIKNDTNILLIKYRLNEMIEMYLNVSMKIQIVKSAIKQWCINALRRFIRIGYRKLKTSNKISSK